MTSEQTIDTSADEHPTAPPSRVASRATRRGRGAGRSRIVLPAWLMGWPGPARVAFISFVALAVAVVVFVGLDVALSAGRVHPGVHIGALAVGGKTQQEAAQAVASYVTERSAAPVTVSANGVSWDVTASAVALSVDATALAGDAYSVGRGDAASVIAGRVRAWLVGVEVPLRLSCDEAAMDALVATINETVATPAVDAGVKVDGDRVTRIDPADGTGVNAGEARGPILDAFVSNERLVTLRLGPLRPAIDSAGADQAYADARAMVSGPVTLYYADREWVVPAEQIGDWIGFRRAEGISPPALEAYVVSDEVSSTVLPMVAEVGKVAQNAKFAVSNGTVTITPSQDGLTADAGDLATRLDTVLVGTGERRAELTMQRVQPEITTEKAQAMGISERISTFTTDYQSSNKPRVNNIHTLADALDGTLVAPGATFSFNATVGERTAAKGYQEANAIVNGKLVPQLGGGICQVGTTIFNTVFFSGFPVVERHNHSQYISHYPTGRDATVSWGGPDFKFKNDSENWVLIATGYTNSTITISLYGTKPGYEVSYDTGEWTNVIDPPIKEVPDPTLPAGSRIVDERGVSGRTVVVVRHVLKGGAEIRTDSFKSVYKPAEEVVRVGTGPAGSVPATVTP